MLKSAAGSHVGEKSGANKPWQIEREKDVKGARILPRKNKK
jgi:hypothetical protein